MNLPLNDDVLNQHIQKYARSCVPMGIELTLKLMGQMKVDCYELQDERGNVSRWGGDYDNRIITGVEIRMEFNIPRGANFPIEDMFQRIRSELDSGRYVNCAWRENNQGEYHAFVIYGYEGDEFLAITKHFNDARIHYIDDMGSRLRNIQGSDILTFSVV